MKKYELKDILLVRIIHYWRRKRDSPFSGNGRVYSHSGACNGEFGGAAVSRNQCLFDCTESLF